MPAPEELPAPRPRRIGGGPAAPFVSYPGRPVDGTYRYDRISQLPVEVLELPDTQRGRVSQLPVEALVVADNAKGRVSQLAVEVLVRPDNWGRTSQVPVEVMYRWLYEDVTYVIID
jgi:hypothetical protein